MSLDNRLKLEVCQGFFWEFGVEMRRQCSSDGAYPANRLDIWSWQVLEAL